MIFHRSNLINWIILLNLFLLLVGYALIQGFRMPNVWSMHYYTPSFFDGFFRRSLVGTFLYFFWDLRFNYYFIVSIQFSILSFLFIFLFRIFSINIFGFFMVTLYIISPYGAYLFHEIGYIDQLLYLLLFISIMLFKNYRLFSIFIMTISMFIHEMSLFTIYPIFIVYSYLIVNDIKKIIIYGLSPLIAFLVIYIFFQTVPIEITNNFLNLIEKKSNYFFYNEIHTKDYYSIFHNSFLGERFKIYYSLIHHHLNSILLLFLLSIATLFLNINFLKNKINNTYFFGILVLFASLSPLMLGFFGWDIDRWFFLSFSSIIVLISIVLINTNKKVNFITLRESKYMSLIIIFFFITIVLTHKTHLVYFPGHKPRVISLHSIYEIVKIMGTIPKN